MPAMSKLEQSEQESESGGTAQGGMSYGKCLPRFTRTIVDFFPGTTLHAIRETIYVCRKLQSLIMLSGTMFSGCPAVCACVRACIIRAIERHSPTVDFWCNSAI